MDRRKCAIISHYTPVMFCYNWPDMDGTMLIGFLAGTLTTIAFVPQLTKTWRTKSAGDISFLMLLTFCTGVFLWIVYGLLFHSVPVLITNVVTFILAAAILALKLKYG